MRKTLYLDIKNCLKAITDTNGVPVFKHFDLWNQQVEFIEQETPFAVPAIFIEFKPIEWQQLGFNKQHADALIRVHVVTPWFAQTADYSPLESEMLDYLDLPDLVVKALDNFAPAAGNKFMRINSITNHNHERYVESVEEYKCHVSDISAVTEFTTPVNAQAIINYGQEPDQE